MKVRITPMGLRMRFTETELVMLTERGHLEESIAFGPAPEQRLRYGVEVGPTARLQVRFDGGALVVTLGSGQLAAWTDPGVVSLCEDLVLADGARLHVALEKDMVFSPRESEAP